MHDMKYKIFLLLLTAMGIAVSASAQKVSLSFRQVPLENVLTEITKQTNITFAYSHPDIDPKTPVSIDVVDTELPQALEQLLAGMDVAYEVGKGKVFLFSKQQATAAVRNDSQEKKEVVTGRVYDTQGEPLIGVSVAVQGRTIATLTDVDGAYSIQVPAGATQLRFSFIGFSDVLETVGARARIDVTLKEAITQLDEIVVVGYGTQNKKTMTGSVSVIRAEEVETGSKSTISQALQGKAAGLRVTQISAQAGGGSSLKIRGELSAGAGNDPLIVIDGFPINPTSSLGSGTIYSAGTTDSYLESLNPDDIESISVLKDAASTAIYGARAGHGVILITTKRGSSDARTSINYSGNVSVQTIAQAYQMLDTQQYMYMRNMHKYENYLRENALGIYSNYSTPDTDVIPAFTPVYTYDQIKNIQGTDWMAEVSRTAAILHQHNLSLSGGNATSRYLISGNYMNQEGIIKNNSASRLSFRANLDKDLSKYVSVGLTASYSQNTYNNVPLGDGQYENAGILTAAALFNPTIPIRNSNGDYSIDPNRATSPNPVSLLEIKDVTTKDRIIGSAYMIVKPMAGLEVKLQVGADRRFQDRSSYLPKTVLVGMRYNGMATIRKENVTDYLLDLTATYTKGIGEHHLKALAGYSTQQFNGRTESLQATDFVLDGFSYYNMGAGNERPQVGSGAWKNAFRSFFGRINYDYAGRYLFEATMRADGASNFAPGHQWGYFPSAAAGWVASEEPFMEFAKDWLYMLKLRGSYGETGNYNVGTHIQDYFGVQQAGIIGDKIVTGVRATDLGNPDLTWETTVEMNFGIDIGFLKNRYSATIEYFQREIYDLLSWQNLMSYYEVPSIVANIGTTQSRGFEITLNAVHFDTKDFSWSTTATFSRYEDRWKERSPYWKPDYSCEQQDAYIRSMYTTESLGILQVGQPAPAAQPSLVPGMVIIKDQNGDGLINNDDVVFKGSQDPDLIFGFNNTLRYKNFDFNIYFYGETGRSRYISYMEQWVDALNGQNATAYFFETFNSVNPNGTRPTVLSGSSGFGDFYVKDIYFIRCANIKLGYTFPIKKTIINRLYAYLDVSNPFVITNWTGLDPETDNLNFPYPNVRAYTFGVNITF
jgi:TonB-linked SusC/RagA family outer membrane protein